MILSLNELVFFVVFFFFFQTLETLAFLETLKVDCLLKCYVNYLAV